LDLVSNPSRADPGFYPVRLFLSHGKRGLVIHGFRRGLRPVRHILVGSDVGSRTLAAGSAGAARGQARLSADRSPFKRRIAREAFQIRRLETPETGRCGLRPPRRKIPRFEQDEERDRARRDNEHLRQQAGQGAFLVAVTTEILKRLLLLSGAHEEDRKLWRSHISETAARIVSDGLEHRLPMTEQFSEQPG
jgi:hypothetical protein